MKIYCKDCNAYLGEVNKCKILKGMIRLCPTCYNKLKLADNAMKSKRNTGGTESMPDFFKDIFKL